MLHVVTVASPLRGRARVASRVTAKPRVTLGFPSYSPLWCHNDVIIYLALGYEVLRKRNPPRNAYVSNDVIEYSTLTPRISQRSRDV